LSKNLKVRVPDDPSAIVRPKILDVETFCPKREGSTSELNRDGMMKGRHLDFDIGKRRLERLKQWERYWESD